MAKAERTSALQERNPRYLLCKRERDRTEFSLHPGGIHVEGESVPQRKQVFKDAYKGIAIPSSPSY